MGGDDAGGGGGDAMMDMEGMMEGATDDGGIGGSSGSYNHKTNNLKLQTLLALQELGIVIAVAFMVGGIFFLMIFVEKIYEQVISVYQKKFGKNVEDDVEDPAALVGTFKRYKN